LFSISNEAPGIRLSKRPIEEKKESTCIFNDSYEQESERSDAELAPRSLRSADCRPIFTNLFHHAEELYSLPDSEEGDSEDAHESENRLENAFFGKTGVKSCGGNFRAAETLFDGGVTIQD